MINDYVTEDTIKETIDFDLTYTPEIGTTGKRNVDIVETSGSTKYCTKSEKLQRNQTRTKNQKLLRKVQYNVVQYM